MIKFYGLASHHYVLFVAVFEKRLVFSVTVPDNRIVVDEDDTVKMGRKKTSITNNNKKTAGQREERRQGGGSHVSTALRYHVVFHTRNSNGSKTL